MRFALLFSDVSFPQPAPWYFMQTVPVTGLVHLICPDLSETWGNKADLAAAFLEQSPTVNQPRAPRRSKVDALLPGSAQALSQLRAGLCGQIRDTMCPQQAV